MAKDLREYLKAVRDMGPEFYVETNRPMDPRLEVCVIQHKLQAQNRFPVVFCPEIKGSKIPLVTNLIGDYNRWAVALGIDQATFKKVGEIAIFQEYSKRRSQTRPVQEIPSSEAPVKEVVMRGDDVDLTILPLLHHAELDSGKYVNIGFTVCRDPDTGICNAGVYRHELKSRNELGCFIIPANHGSYIARRYAEMGKPMEIALVCGHHPMVVLGSCASGPLNMNELEVMGSLLGEPLRVTRGETVDLPVPADAEIVIEGTVDTRQWITDGPYAEYQGYYGDVTPCYLMKVSAITMRKDAIFHDLDNAHREHITWSVLSHEYRGFQAVKAVVPTIKAMHIFPHTLGFKIAAVSIRKRVPGEARLAGLAALQDFQVKVSVVVDEEIDVYNEAQVLWAVGTRTLADRGVHIIPDLLAPGLDPTAYDESRQKKGTMVTKVVIDATRPIGLPFAIPITPPKDLWESMELEDYLKVKLTAAV
ncbi:MAG: UbiD family decarboxylase [Chloroflexi bacterium]|nr:UbiD family decarboxylase [Chloroflexota bacterium]